MSRHLRSRRLIALLAAYVVALQALLLPLTVAAGAAFDGSLCAAAASASVPAAPVSHDNGCACAAGCGMQCCAQTLAGPPWIAALPDPARIAIAGPLPAIETRLAPTKPTAPHARAPPSA